MNLAADALSCMPTCFVALCDGVTLVFDMCFLGVFLGAPGGPPAASLGGPRGHGREEGGENGGKS